MMMHLFSTLTLIAILVGYVPNSIGAYILEISPPQERIVDIVITEIIENPTNTLIVKLEARRTGNWVYGLNEYEVFITVLTYEGETIQKITTLEVSYDLSFGNRIFIDPDNPFNLHFADYSQDGYFDMGLRIAPGGSLMNDPHYFWLWDPNKGQFVRNAELESLSWEASVRLGEDGNIHTHSRITMGHDVVRIYSFVDRKLTHVETRDYVY